MAGSEAGTEAGEGPSRRVHSSCCAGLGGRAGVVSRVSRVLEMHRSGGMVRAKPGKAKRTVQSQTVQGRGRRERSSQGHTLSSSLPGGSGTKSTGSKVMDYGTKWHFQYSAQPQNKRACQQGATHCSRAFM